MNYAKIVMMMAVVALFLVRYLMSGTEKKAAVKDGAIVLKMNKIYGVAGFFIVLVSMAIIIISGLKTGEFSEEIKTIALPVIFLILGGILFLLSVNVCIMADEEKITYYNILRRKKQIMWKDIKRVIFNQKTLELILYTSETEIKIHIYLVGFLSFVKLMKSKLNYEIYKDAVSIIDTYKRQL